MLLMACFQYLRFYVYIYSSFSSDVSHPPGGTPTGICVYIYIIYISDYMYRNIVVNISVNYQIINYLYIYIYL